MNFILYQPFDNLVTISTFVPLFKYPIFLYPVPAPLLTFNPAVVFPVAITSPLEPSKLTYAPDTYPYEPLYFILYQPFEYI